jgi:mRNA-capping enzyme
LVTDCPLKQDRYKLIEKEVERPRNIERGFMNTKPLPTFLYRYELEPFGLRRKEFWPLDKSTKLLKDFIPNLTHESDGLILQVGKGRGGGV